jgi:hypothetical protein
MADRDQDFVVYSHSLTNTRPGICTADQGYAYESAQGKGVVVSQFAFARIGVSAFGIVDPAAVVLVVFVKAEPGKDHEIHQGTTSQGAIGVLVIDFGLTLFVIWSLQPDDLA